MAGYSKSFCLSRRCSLAYYPGVGLTFLNRVSVSDLFTFLERDSLQVEHPRRDSH